MNTLRILLRSLKVKTLRSLKVNTLRSLKVFSLIKESLSGHFNLRDIA